MGSYAQIWKARVALLRPGNGLMAAVATLLGGALLLGPSWILESAGLAAAFAAFLITGFGNVLNDIIDVDLDRVAHPDRPLPSGQISVSQAQGFAAILLGFGLYEAWIAAGWPTLLFAGANALVLVLYERGLKQRGWPGNVAVAALVASAFLFGATATGADPSGWSSVIALAGLAFLSNLARELCKDLEDAEADRHHRTTLAMQLGPRARWLADGWILLAVAISGLVAWNTSGMWIVALIGANLAFLGGIAARDPGQAQRIWKAAMLLALGAFAWLAALP
ncbi:MAG: UbiA family prenyltransferase [Thermoplasmatota archaeon]